LTTGAKAGSPMEGRLFMSLVVLLAVAGLGLELVLHPSLILNPKPGTPVDLLVWTGVVATVELLPVPLAGVLHLSLGFPILLGVAILYDPIIAALVAMIGSCDIREVRGEITPLKSLFNRAQI